MVIMMLDAYPTTQGPSSVNGRPLIRLEEVNKVFKLGSGEFQALKDINLYFHTGDYAVIMGKSGSGKSTLINMITGIDVPSSGRVRVGEVELNRMTQGDMAVWRGPNMGVVFQFFQLLPMLTVLENTILPMDFTNQYPLNTREKRAMELLDMVGMADVADKLPAALSGGQQQAAAIARALANDPPILVGDEPTGNLDSRTAERILTIFEDLALQGKTILIVTHDISLAQRASRRIVISDGEVINESLAKTFSALPHNMLMELTRLIVERSYPVGATVARKGSTDNGFFLVVKGAVDIIRRCEKGDQEVLGQIRPGEYFSILEMQESPSCDLCYKAAAPDELQVLSLETETFHNFLANEPSLAEMMQAQAKQRSQDYCSRPRRKFFWRR
jgi:ABC-type lipoprotein export system ATPase subunit